MQGQCDSEPDASHNIETRERDEQRQSQVQIVGDRSDKQVHITADDLNDKEVQPDATGGKMIGR